MTLGKISKKRSEARANNGEVVADASQTQFGSEKAGCQTEYNQRDHEYVGHKALRLSITSTFHGCRTAQYAASSSRNRSNS